MVGDVFVLIAYSRAGLSSLNSVLMGQRLSLYQLFTSHTYGDVRIRFLRVLAFGYPLLLI